MSDQVCDSDSRGCSEYWLHCGGLSAGPSLAPRVDGQLMGSWFSLWPSGQAGVELHCPVSPPGLALLCNCGCVSLLECSRNGGLIPVRQAIELYVQFLQSREQTSCLAGAAQPGPSIKVRPRSVSLARGRLGLGFAAGVHAQGALLGTGRPWGSQGLAAGPCLPAGWNWALWVLPLSHPALWALAVTSPLEQRQESLYFLVLNRNLDTWKFDLTSCFLWGLRGVRQLALCRSSPFPRELRTGGRWVKCRRRSLLARTPLGVGGGAKKLCRHYDESLWPSVFKSHVGVYSP